MNLDKYPTPIAATYHAMLTTDNIHFKFRAVLKVFAVTLKYSALVIISDYLRMRQRGIVKNQKIDLLFVNLISRPSLGQWNNLLRDILLVLGTLRDAMFIPEYYDIYFGRDKRNNPNSDKVEQYITHLIAVRNKYVHPDIFTSDSEAQILYEECKKKLDIILSSMAFLEKYLLVKRFELDGQEEICQGIIADHRQLQDQLISFRLERNAAMPDNDRLNLGSFCYHADLETSGAKSVLLYESLRENKVDYALGNYYLAVEAKDGTQTDSAKDLHKWISQLTVELDQELTRTIEVNARTVLAHELSKGRIEWNAFQSYTETLSQSTYLRFVAEHTFKAGLYVERDEVNTELQGFLESDKRGLILVAESGLGKTNLLCQWAQRLLQQKQATLLFYGREYDGSEISDMICNQLQLNNKEFKNSFQGDFFALLKILDEIQEIKKRHRQVVILVDAVNEYNKPEELFERLLRFIEQLPYPWIKVILSIRTFVWENLKDTFSFEKDVFYRSKDLTGRPVPCLPLVQFNEKELELAYARYKQSFNLRSSFSDLSEATKRLLRNPLLLRFASEAYSGTVLPARLFTIEIFKQYGRERINAKDNYFLEYLTEAMWRLGSDELSIDMFETPQQGSDNDPLEMESIVYPSQSTLAEKLREYVFSIPVYETMLVPACIIDRCPKYHKELSVEQFALMDDNVKQKCFDCGAVLGTMNADYRTTYDRLLSENIIQRFSKGEDTAIRFTYDRMFEYYMGKFIRCHVLTDFLDRGEMGLREVTGKIRNTYVFWGALKNVLVEYLRKEKATNSFWWNVIEAVPEEGKTDEQSEGMKLLHREIELATRQILSSSFEDYYQEDSNRSLELISYLTALQSATSRTSLIALDCTQTVLAALPELSTRSRELDAVRLGLKSQFPEVRSEACKIVTSLYMSNSEVAISIMEEIHNELLSALRVRNIVSLIHAHKQKYLLQVVDSYFQLILSLLGMHFSEEGTRKRIVSMTIALLKNPLFVLLKVVLRIFIPSKLASIYWGKGPLPCNYIDMYICLGGPWRTTTKTIGSLFSSSEKLLAQKDLLDWCKIENGLISWYLYSLIPIHAQNKEETEEILLFLETAFEKGNRVTQYIVVKSLWILTEFSSVPSALTEPLFEKYSIKILEIQGPTTIYSHAIPLDETINRYLEEKNEKGHKRVYWATYENGNLVMYYDNTVLFDLAAYQMRKKEVPHFQFMIDLLDKCSDERRIEILVASISSLGRLGTTHDPGPALKTLQIILEKYLSENKNVIFEGQQTTLMEVLADALLKIKSFHPQRVDYFIEHLEERDHSRLRKVSLAAVDKKLDYLDSYYGELIYQKSFLTSSLLRGVFGRGISRASQARTVDKLFGSFVKEFLQMFSTLKT